MACEVRDERAVLRRRLRLADRLQSARSGCSAPETAGLLARTILSQRCYGVRLAASEKPHTIVSDYCVAPWNEQPSSWS